MTPALVTVLRSGGDFRAEHVERLAAQAAAHAPGIEFICLTDVPGVPGATPLLEHWPGWWSKMELFDLEGPLLYLDLDTTICGPIDDLLEAACAAEFIALRDFNPRARAMGSGLMAWRGDLSHLYREFAEDPARHIAENRTPRHWGDQGYLEPRTDAFRVSWQDIAPGRVVSWKKDCKRGVPEGAAIVCFHGKPRPWEIGQ